MSGPWCTVRVHRGPLTCHDAPTSDGPRPAGDFWRLWASSGLSSLADGVLKAVLPLVAMSWTSNPALVAGVSVAFALLWLLCALPAGVLVDRVDRRRAIAIANAVRAVAAGGPPNTPISAGRPHRTTSASFGADRVEGLTALVVATFPFSVRESQLAEAEARYTGAGS